MTTVRFDFHVGNATSLAFCYPAIAATPRATILLGHGAGGSQSHPWMVVLAEALAARALDVVTFDFLYAHEKRRLPDKNDRLEETFAAAVDAVRRQIGRERPLFIGGKSMGGRIATQIAATRAAGAISGVVLLGYPLHPPGNRERLRAAHLPRVQVPMLFVQGSRDTFGTPDELAPIVSSLCAGTRLWVVAGGDHSLIAPKGKARGGVAGGKPGVGLAETLAPVADEIARFCREVSDFSG